MSFGLWVARCPRSGTNCEGGAIERAQGRGPGAGAGAGLATTHALQHDRSTKTVPTMQQISKIFGGRQHIVKTVEACGTRHAWLLRTSHSATSIGEGELTTQAACSLTRSTKAASFQMHANIACLSHVGSLQSVETFLHLVASQLRARKD